MGWWGKKDPLRSYDKDNYQALSNKLYKEKQTLETAEESYLEEFANEHLKATEEDRSKQQASIQELFNLGKSKEAYRAGEEWFLNYPYADFGWFDLMCDAYEKSAGSNAYTFEDYQREISEGRREVRERKKKVEEAIAREFEDLNSGREVRKRVKEICEDFGYPAKEFTVPCVVSWIKWQDAEEKRKRAEREISEYIVEKVDEILTNLENRRKFAESELTVYRLSQRVNTQVYKKSRKITTEAYQLLMVRFAEYQRYFMESSPSEIEKRQLREDTEKWFFDRSMEFYERGIKEHELNRLERTKRAERLTESRILLFAEAFSSDEVKEQSRQRREKERLELKQKRELREKEKRDNPLKFWNHLKYKEVVEKGFQKQEDLTEFEKDFLETFAAKYNEETAVLQIRDKVSIERWFDKRKPQGAFKIAQKWKAKYPYADFGWFFLLYEKYAGEVGQEAYPLPDYFDKYLPK